MRARQIAVALAGALTGCTSLGGTVRGDFTCRAAQGTCAPLSVNDAGALATLTRDVPAPAARERVIAAGATRAGERLLTVFVPAHVDADGALHDAATVHIVAEPARWEAVPASTEVPPAIAFSRSVTPSLRGIIAGAQASAVEGLELPPARAPQPLPSAAALEAARAGHRILKPSLTDALAAPPTTTVDPATPSVRRMNVAPLAAPSPDQEPK